MTYREIWVKDVMESLLDFLDEKKIISKEEFKEYMLKNKKYTLEGQ